MNKADKPLNARQQKFAELYDGNGTESARQAGYFGNDNVLAQQARHLLRNPQIVAFIRARAQKDKAPKIAKREARQRFWTRVMNNAGEKMADRLRASELLGKSEADFTDNVAVKGNVTAAVVVIDEQQFKQLRDKFNSEY